jgi:hypothetical protein
MTRAGGARRPRLWRIYHFRILDFYAFIWLGPEGGGMGDVVPFPRPRPAQQAPAIPPETADIFDRPGSLRALLVAALSQARRAAARDDGS